MNYIKSPLNYTGGKYKLLEQIIPKFPKTNTFVDVFAGGFNVGINMNTDTIIYNDVISPLCDLMKALRDNDRENILEYIDSTIREFNLSKTNKEEFYTFRDYYNNESNNSLDLFILSCFSFNHDIRFNNDGKFNKAAGTNRSHFTKNMRNNLIKFKDKMDSMDLKIYNMSFEDIKYDSNCFYYFDPPYLLTDADYNLGWDESKEEQLISLLDGADFKFALSNVLTYNDLKNESLIELVENNDNLNVISINSNYSNCSYHKKKRTKENEVLITNYVK